MHNRPSRNLLSFLAISAAVFCCAILSPAISRAALPGWNLVDAQFNSNPINIDSIDAAGIHLAASAASPADVIPWESVLEISHPVEIAQPAVGSAFQLYLTGGDKLGGSPVSIDGDNLKWRSATLGDLSLPMTRVLGIAKTGAAVPNLDEIRKDDVVQLANGDVTHGIVTQIDSAGVTIQAGGASPTLPFDSVSAILLASTAGGAGANKPMYRVQFNDGASVSVPSITYSGNELVMHFDAQTARAIDPATVAGIEQLNGPISWLTSRTPVENIYKPFFQENFPTRFDRTVDDGTPIREKYPAFHHGIGCHSYSKLTYALDGKFAGFRTQFGVESDSPLADVTVRILLDEKVVFEKKNVKAGPPFAVVMLPLAEAKTLSLEVDYGENYATEDRFVWLDPALLRTLPPPAPEPPTPQAAPTTDPAAQGPATAPATQASASAPTDATASPISPPATQASLVSPSTAP